ncbi:hypothetical protein WKI40_08445 [Kosakonia sacchari]|uniref:hypothetical protein n=1 Tax=Kosakonia TaxID=1330547 RepID=UPI00190A4A8A
MKALVAAPPHVSQHPEPVLAEFRCLINEVALISLYPVVCIILAEMPVTFAKLAQKIGSSQALIALWDWLNSNNECSVNLVVDIKIFK